MLLESAICNFEGWNYLVSGTGSERTRIFGTVRPLSRRLSYELKMIIDSLVKEATRQIPYISVEPRSIRVRYILVAAMSLYLAQERMYVAHGFW